MTDVAVVTGTSTGMGLWAAVGLAPPGADRGRDHARRAGPARRQLLGQVALTQPVLPAMREAGYGRVLTVTSVGGAVGQPFADAYCGAKFAVEGFMQSLAATAGPFGVWVSVIEPAAVASEFAANADRLDGERVLGVTRTWVS